MTIPHNIAVKSDFSLGESTLTAADIVTRAKELGYQSIALVDTMTISSMVGFAEKAKEAGLRPLVGCTLRVYQDPTYRKPAKATGIKEIANPFYHLKVFVQSEAGLRSLFRLLSLANSESHYYYHARVGLDEVMTLEDVAVTTGDFFNLFRIEDHRAHLAALSAKFPTYVEFVPINTPLFDTLNARALRAASDLGLGVVASYPTLYSTDQDANSLDVLRAIATNTQTSSRALPIPYVRDFRFRAVTELVPMIVEMGQRLGVDDPVGLSNRCVGYMDKLVQSCQYEFKKLPPCLPVMAEDPFMVLARQCAQGWKSRFERPVMGHKPGAADIEQYKARLKYELDVLKRMDFSGYFLLVQDIVQWSKSNSIKVGPGRGSVGGSLVAYLMGITDVDPIRFGLLFERFINPSRIDLPDADLDFMSSRRPEVIEYIVGKYGKDKVAGVSNYTSLGAASALRDVARLSGIHAMEYACSKQMEKEHGVSLSLEESAERVPDIGKYKAAHPDLWDHSVRLEGRMRGLGRHAAGIVVANEPLINRAVVETRSGDSVVNWDKNVVESFGLIKIDILGLSTLDVLQHGIEYVKRRHGITLDFLSLPLDEPDVMRAFGRGDTTAVFQFESGGMKKLLKQLAEGGELTFADITAATALYRPGPIDAGLVDQFVAVKQGKSTPHYEHEAMREALTETHGVITYQEQVMKVCIDLAGFSAIDADHVRKAMGKKDAVKLAKYKEQFIAGSVASGMTEYAADILWEKILGFAGYAFNKSHSVEYSVISYWAMYLKVRYPAEFYAASMSVVDDEEKLASLVLDARRFGIEVMPPDINKSSDRIEIEGEKVLLAPFQAIKGISTNTAAYILTVRKKHGKPFTSPKDFEEAVTAAKLGAKVNKAHRDKLERVGAYASISGKPNAALNPATLRDRIELMPGFTIDAVKPDRGIDSDRLTVMKLIRLAEDTRACDKCPLAGKPHPTPQMGKSAKFMMVFDTPTWDEAKKGRFLEGDTAKLIRAGLNDCGMALNDGYYTALVKSPKPGGEKMLSNESIIACSDHLAKEIEILKPPVIIAMGGNAIRYFAPGIKGGAAELVGKVTYDPKRDASIIFGFNPAQIIFDPSKGMQLRHIFNKLADLLA